MSSTRLDRRRERPRSVLSCDVGKKAPRGACDTLLLNLSNHIPPGTNHIPPGTLAMSHGPANKYMHVSYMWTLNRLSTAAHHFPPCSISFQTGMRLLPTDSARASPPGGHWPFQKPGRSLPTEKGLARRPRPPEPPHGFWRQGMPEGGSFRKRQRQIFFKNGSHERSWPPSHMTLLIRRQTRSCLSP